MDINFINIIIAIATILFGYLIGSFPSSLIVAKIFKKEDPRNFGSKNSGGTNASRLWGFKIGVLVYILDFLKLALPLWTCWAIYVFVKFNGMTICPSAQEFMTNQYLAHYCYWPVYYLIIISVVAGHCFPIFASFKGGKAAACTFSSTIFVSWFVGLCTLVVFASTLKIKKYVSLAAIIGSIVATTAAWLTIVPGLSNVVMYGNTMAPHWLYGLVMTLSSIILIYRHKSNIVRLIKGEERKISWM